MKAFAHQFAFEFRTGIRNKILLLMNYLLPLGFYLMMGFVIAQISPDFKQTLIPSMAVFAAMVATVLGMPDPLVRARETGILRSYKIAGIPSISILVIPALTTVLHLVIVSTIIAVSAPLLFDAPIPASWLSFVMVFVAMALCLTGISVLIAVIASSSRMVILWSQLIFIPTMMLGGITFPIDFLPNAARKVAQLLPSTHAMNAFKWTMGQETAFTPWGSVIVLALSGLLAFMLSVYLFSWDARNTERRGHPALALLILLPFIAGIFLFS